MQKEMSLSYEPTHRHLNSLVKDKYLLRKKEGKRTYYKINKKHPVSAKAQELNGNSGNNFRLKSWEIVFPIVVFAIIAGIFFLPVFFPMQTMAFSRSIESFFAYERSVISFEERVSISYDSSGTYNWVPENRIENGILLYIEVDGYFSGEGEAKIYLDTENEGILIFDSEKIKDPVRGVSGNIIKEVRDLPKTVPAGEIEKIQESGETISEKIAVDLPLQKFSFSRTCENSCDVHSLELDDAEYSLYFEIAGEAEVEITRFRYAYGITEIETKVDYIVLEEKEDFNFEVEPEMIENDLVVSLKHDSNENEFIYVVGNLTYGILRNPVPSQEETRVRAYNWEGEYFEIWIGERLGVFAFGEKFHEVNPVISNSRGEVVSARIEFKEVSTVHDKLEILDESIQKLNIPKGRYTVEILPENQKIQRIVLEEFEVFSDVPEILRFEDVPAEKTIDGAVSAYAIDPTIINFTVGRVTVTAEGDVLYKCADWEFETQTCHGDWNFMQDIVPGEDYTFILTPDDPGFAEVSISSCAAQSNTAVKGSFNISCDYPDGSSLLADDGIIETHSFGKAAGGTGNQRYAGVRINSLDSDITDCSEITKVELCYEWWRTNHVAEECDISLNVNGTYTTVISDCPGTIANPGVTCVDVTGLENWDCDNFFGSEPIGVLIKSEIGGNSGTGAGYTGTATWDVLMFNVSYGTETIPEEPEIIIHEPTRRTYTKSPMLLNITVKEDIDADACWFVFNETENITMNSDENNTFYYYFELPGPTPRGGERAEIQFFCNDTSESLFETEKVEIKYITPHEMLPINPDREYINDILFARPQIIRNHELDKDDDGIEDALQEKIKTHPNEIVEVIITTFEKPTQEEIDEFISLGGELNHVYEWAIYGFSGEIEAKNIRKLRDKLGFNVVLIEESFPLEMHMDYSIQMVMARPVVWETYGYTGSNTSSLVNLDSGVDPTHPDTYGYVNVSSEGWGAVENVKIVGWYDVFGENSTPVAIREHGAVTSSIAVGTGDSYGTESLDNITITQKGNTASNTYNYTYTFNATQAGEIIVDYLALATETRTKVIGCYYPNGTKMALQSGSESGTANPLVAEYYTSVAGIYKCDVGIVGSGTPRSFSVLITYPYQNVGDGYGLFTGVAPDSKLVAVKALNNAGGGTGANFLAGLDWIIANKAEYGIKSATVQLGFEISVSSINTAMNNIVANGIPISASAGNNFCGTATNTDEVKVVSPSVASKAIAVGGINYYGEMSWFSSRGGEGSGKPDVVAPAGGSSGPWVCGADSNFNDASNPDFPDRNPNDTTFLRGTSASSAHVGGMMALMIDAWEDINNQSWSYREEDALKMKSIILMTAWETNKVGEYCVHRGMNNTPTLDRGDKDLVEGYGRINVDAAIEAIIFNLEIGSTENVVLSNETFGKKVWARNVNLLEGHTYRFDLSVPGTADFDLFVYSSAPNLTSASIGDPILLEKSVNDSLGDDESISISPTESGTYYVVVKQVEGSGEFELNFYSTPVVETRFATDIQNGSALLQGELFELSGYGSADVWFEYRERGESEWNSTENQTVTQTGLFSYEVNLTSGTEYEFRALAETGEGASTGEIRIFITDNYLAWDSGDDWNLAKLQGLEIDGDSIKIDTAKRANISNWCAATSGNTIYGDFIQRVRFNGIDWESGNNGGYVDATTNITNRLIPGETYTLYVTVGDEISQYITAAFDWNGNGTFDYVALVGIGDNLEVVSKDITIPYIAGKENRSSLMRVMSNYNVYLYDPCGSRTYGETEDYTIYIREENVFAETDIRSMRDGQPELVNLSYVLNGQNLNISVIGSPGTANEEIIKTIVDGETEYTLGWMNSHEQFMLRVDMETDNDTVTPVLNASIIENGEVIISNLTPLLDAKMVALDTKLSAFVQSQNYPVDVEFYLGESLVHSEEITEAQTVETDALSLNTDTTYNWTVQMEIGENVYSRESYFETIRTFLPWTTNEDWANNTESLNIFVNESEIKLQENKTNLIFRNDTEVTKTGAPNEWRTYYNTTFDVSALDEMHLGYSYRLVGRFHAQGASNASVRVSVDGTQMYYRTTVGAQTITETWTDTVDVSEKDNATVHFEYYSSLGSTQAGNATVTVYWAENEYTLDEGYFPTGYLETATKTMINSVPDLVNLSYALNGQNITLKVIGSPGTIDEEIVTQELTGEENYTLSWNEPHMDFRIRAEFETDNSSETPVLDNVTIMSTQAGIEITLISPENGSLTHSRNVDFVCGASSDLNHISNATFYWNLSGSWESNGTIGLGGYNNQTNFTRIFGENTDVLWNCEFCEDDGNCEFAEANWTAGINVPPSVIINAPMGETYGGLDYLIVSAKVSDSDGVDSVVANIYSLSTEESWNVTLGFGQESDNFDTGSIGTNWEIEETIDGTLECTIDMDETAEGKLFMNMNGSGDELTGALCSLISKKRIDGDFDINVSFELGGEMELDTAINFQLSNINSSADAIRYAFIGLTNFAGYGQTYDVFVDDMDFSGYIGTRETEDTYGKFRIKREDNNFTFYTWNNTASEWHEEEVSKNEFNLDHALYVVMEVESALINWGTINVTWGDFEASDGGNYFAEYSLEGQGGEHLVRLIANDTLGAVNDTETTTFEVDPDKNYPPAIVYLLTPAPDSFIKDNFLIQWTNPSDPNDDSLRFNITLLNSDGELNSSIITDYGNDTTISYLWNTTTVDDGIYSLNLTVYENETLDGYSKTDSLMPKTFTVDNTPPEISVESPLNETYNSSTIWFNLTVTDEFGIETCRYSLNGNANITMDNNSATHWYYSDSANEGSNNVVFYCLDNAGNQDSEIVYFSVDTTAPEFYEWVQTPPQLVSTTSGDLNIKVNISDATGVSNTPSPRIYYNNSGTVEQAGITPENPGYANLSLIEGDVKNGTWETNITHWFYRPTQYNVLILNESLFEMTWVDIWRDYSVKVNLSDIYAGPFVNYRLDFYVENKTELTGEMNVFYCNSSYISGDYREDSNCTYINTIDSSSMPIPYGRRGVSFSTNEFGMFNGVQVTSDSQFVFCSRFIDNEEDAWEMRRVNVTGSSNSFISSNNGTSWSEMENYEADVHIHWFDYDNNQQFQYWGWANDTLGNEGNSTMQYDIWKSGQEAPSKPKIITPEEGNIYSGVFNITWLESHDPNRDYFEYNLSLMNPDKSFNFTINDSVPEGTDYYGFNTSLVDDGEYKLRIEVCDIFDNCDSGIMANSFTIDNTAPVWSSQSQNTSTPEEGENVLLSVYWEDNFELSHAILATNETGDWDNKTTYGSPMTLSGNESWSNFTWNNASVTEGTTVGWRIYANDSAGNWNVTDEMSFTITEDVCIITLSSNLMEFGSINPGTDTGNNNLLINITNDGTAQADNTTVFGTIWSDGNSLSMPVTQTRYGESNTTYSSLTELTDSAVVLPSGNILGGSTLQTYWGLAIPVSQSAAEYAQTITVTMNC